MKLLIAILLFTAITGCRSFPPKLPDAGPHDINQVIEKMTDIMIHDVTNPPLAARFFSYACLAGYEVVSQNDSGYKSMHGILNKYPLIKKPDSIRGYSYPLAALLAMIETAKKMQPSGKLFEQYENHFLDSCAAIGYPADVIEASRKYALYISKQVLGYAKADGYNKISNFARYTPESEEGSWYPTPPAYLAAIEPYFNTVRPFALDSCSQFKPEPPIPFSKEKNSAFFQLLQQNYKDTLSDEHRMMAAFWDCNPFAVQDNGHLMVGLKKISPGAHWLGITGIACKKAHKSFSQSMKIFTMVSMGLMDGFICCWDEKYRSNRIRPETAIRKYIDPNWKPLLQTPPFPEYLSGHSTISAASAQILTFYLGENFQYIDSTELRFGLPPRNFISFTRAAEEAAISRFYGGIHFMDAITNGVKQGRSVSNLLIQKVERTPF
ncbi:MAG: vanadium-dependent haloperoxidase [Chitinophagaceae bacterium]